MQITAIFLDLDGTLVDSNQRHVDAWVRAFAEGGHDLPAERIAGQIGKGADQLVPALIDGASDDEAETLGDAHGRIFKRDHLHQVTALPGARDLVQRVHDSGRLVVLASSAGEEELAHYCDLLGIGELVDFSTSIEDVEASKPAPDIFAVARDKAGVSADAVVVIGDSPFDMEGAARCGMVALGVRSGKFADQVLKDAGAHAIYDDAADIVARWDETLMGKSL